MTSHSSSPLISLAWRRVSAGVCALSHSRSMQKADISPIVVSPACACLSISLASSLARLAPSSCMCLVLCARASGRRTGDSRTHLCCRLCRSHRSRPPDRTHMGDSTSALVATLERMDRNTPPRDGLSTLKLTRAASHDHALPCQQQLSSSHASSCLEGGAGRREERREEMGRPRGRHPLPTPSPSPPTRPPLLTCDRTHATTHPSPLPQNEAPTSPPPFTHPRLHGKAFSASGSPRFFVVVVDSPSACIPAWPALMWFWARRPSPLLEAGRRRTRGGGGGLRVELGRLVRSCVAAVGCRVGARPRLAHRT